MTDGRRQIAVTEQPNKASLTGEGSVGRVDVQGRGGRPIDGDVQHQTGEHHLHAVPERRRAADSGHSLRMQRSMPPAALRRDAAYDNPELLCTIRLADGWKLYEVEGLRVFGLDDKARSGVRLVVLWQQRRLDF